MSRNAVSKFASIAATLALIALAVYFVVGGGQQALASVSFVSGTWNGNNCNSGTVSGSLGMIVAVTQASGASQSLPPASAPSFAPGVDGAMSGPLYNWAGLSTYSGEGNAIAWVVVNSAGAGYSVGGNWSNCLVTPYSAVGEYGGMTFSGTTQTATYKGATVSAGGAETFSVSSTTGDLVLMAMYAASGGSVSCTGGFSQSEPGQWWTVATGSTTSTTCTYGTAQTLVTGAALVDFSSSSSGTTTTTGSSSSTTTGSSSTTTGTTTTTAATTTVPASTTTTICVNINGNYVCGGTSPTTLGGEYCAYDAGLTEWVCQTPTTTTTTLPSCQTSPDTTAGTGTTTSTTPCNPNNSTTGGTNCDWWDPVCWIEYLLEPSSGSVSTLESDIGASGISGLATSASSASSNVLGFLSAGDSGTSEEYGALGGPDGPYCIADTGYMPVTISTSGANATTNFNINADGHMDLCWFQAQTAAIMDPSGPFGGGATVLGYIKDLIDAGILITTAVGCVLIINRAFASGK